MRVCKRDGTLQLVSFDKVLNRISNLSNGLSIDPSILAQQVCGRIFDQITTTDLDEFASSLSASMSLENLDYEILASRIIISNHHKNTSPDYVEVVEKMSSFLDERFVNFVNENAMEINEMIKYDRDYLFDYFGFKTLEKGRYLYKSQKDNKVIERPQHMIMRMAIGIHLGEIQSGHPVNQILNSIKETYELISQKKYTHATPTLFNAGTKRPQLSSCFLIDLESDSIEGIYNTLKDCALISKEAGGIGLAIHKVRAKNSEIKGTNGISNGLVPMLKVFNETAKYVDQCVTPDTIIYTSDGPLEIKHCATKFTKVFNASGKCELIDNVLEHKFQGEILIIKSDYYNYDLKITPGHPVYALQLHNQTFENTDSIAYSLNLKLLNLDYVEAKELKSNDYIAFTIPKYNEDYLNLTSEDCIMYGIMMSEDNQVNMFERFLCINKKYQKSIEFTKEYFGNRYIKYDEILFEDSVKIHWTFSTVLPFRHSDIYNRNKEKGINIRWLNLPSLKTKQILQGFLNFTSGNFVSSNNELIDSIKFLCIKNGVVPKIVKNEIESKPTSKIVEMPFIKDFIINGNMDTHFIKYDGHILVPIKSINSESFDGMMYDLQMSFDHNYMLENGIVHNGGGKRKGSFAVYLEPWHADIQDFLDLKKSRGSEELRARDLFYALWIPDLFMKRVKEEKNWTLFSPSQCPDLNDKCGVEFEQLYCMYEEKYPENRRVSAQELWRQILTNSIETGGPSILFKDHCNNKSNHKHLGTIQSSNLCTEIIQYSSPTETAVCNLASICLPSFVYEKKFNYEELRLTVHKIVENLNRVINVNYYPTDKCMRSNQRHRPIGIGVQGLADMFHMMEIAWEDPVAIKINKNIFEVIYYSALEKSNQLAQLYGVYSTYVGSPLSFGILQFDFTPDVKPTGVNNICKWDELRESIKRHGCYNSLLVAPMPTASTSQIMGFSECFEPYTSNIFIRRTNAGEFKLVNKYLIKKLIQMNLWKPEIRNKIIMQDGSIQWMDDSMHPDVNRIKLLYKTIWELKHRLMIDFACERGAFIDQSQSFNVYMEEPTINKLNSAYFYSWERGLKTCQYYLRIRTKAKAIQFTVDPTLSLNIQAKANASIGNLGNSPGQNSSDSFVCNRDTSGCASCSS